MAYRNYKIIYKNIILKKNVMFVNAYNITEAYVKASKVLERIGLDCTDSRYDGHGGRIYHFNRKDLPSKWHYQVRSDDVIVEIVNLHFRRKK